MNVDPQLAAYYSQVDAEFPPVSAPDALDALSRRSRNKRVADRFAPPSVPDVSIQQIDVPLEGRTLKARLYRPSQIDEALPLVVYFHGGGWVIGDLDTHEQVPAQLAADARVAVASIEYRLAPEFPFPAPNDDAEQALLWFAEQRVRLNLSLRTLAVAGDSAGAYLATYVERAANLKVPGLVKAQLLFYPVVRPSFNSTSYTRFAEGPVLTRNDMIWFWGAFLEEPVTIAGASEQRTMDPRVTLTASIPDYAPADAVVMVAGIDPLHDEGVEYAKFLELHGGDVELIEASDMTHGFARLQHVSDAARDWMRSAATALREML
ncbi:alpha/beta hydrolase [Pararobbsia alpina]|uniref:alpha/beta hydrolase n=1 Tax=Pararobbsia alpina TaxID=621374 RepID=UPI0015816C8E|nr:alpha/beta hydrolase [Pararobbsia alpina]